MRRSFVTLLPVLVALAACGNDNDPGPGGVTQGEARALDEAAEMLDARKPAPIPATSEEPAPEPSSS